MNQSQPELDALRLQASELWEAWVADLGTSIDEVLVVAEHLTAEQVVELVIRHQAKNWQEGVKLTADDYLRRFPQLLDNDECVVDLIYEEFLLARDGDSSASPDDYYSRYPRFAEPLRKQLEFDEIFDDNLGVDEVGVTAGLPASIGRYEVKELVGVGGMGVVYKAWDPEVERFVALKLPRRELLTLDADHTSERLSREIRAVGKLDHKNVATIFDVMDHEGTPVIVMEWIEGRTLRDELNRGPLADSTVESIARLMPIVEAVAVAHQNGIVHQDIKPENIIFDANGEPKLTDFGLAWLSRDQKPMPGGTKTYIAPEMQRRELDRLGPWSDVHSLGVLLWECVGGDLQLIPKSDDEIDDFQTAVTIAVAPDFGYAITRAVAPLPESRFATAAEFHTELETAWKSFTTVQKDYLEPGEADQRVAEPTKAEFRRDLSEQIPTGWRLLWMMFMQPIRLSRFLRRNGIECPEKPIPQMWFGGEDGREIRRKYITSLAVVTLSALVITFVILFAASYVVFDSPEAVKLHQQGVLIAIAAGTAGGVLLGLFRGPAWAVSWSLSWVVASAIVGSNVLPLFNMFPVSADLLSAARDGLLAGVVLGISGGICRSVGENISRGRPAGVIESIAFGTVCAVLLGMSFGLLAPWLNSWMGHDVPVTGVRAAVIAGMSAGFAFGVIGIATMLRVWIYPIECLWQLTIFFVRKFCGVETLHLSPVHWHELAPLPYPTLAAHILITDESDESLVRTALAACDLSQSQSSLAKNTRSRLFADKVLESIEQKRYRELSSWLTEAMSHGPVKLLNPLRNAIAALARVDAAESSAADSSNACDELAVQTATLEQALRDSRTPLADELQAVLPLLASKNERRK